MKEQKARFESYVIAIQDIKNQVEKRYYFQEEDVLSARPTKDSWSVVEHIAHLNLVNFQYINQMNRVDFDSLPMASNATLSWFGRFFTWVMQPKSNGKPLFKMPAPSNLQPVSVQHEGTKILPRVAFQDFMNDLSTLQKIAQQAQNKNINRIGLTTAIGSWLKLNLVDAFEVMLAHMHRHLKSMERIDLGK